MKQLQRLLSVTIAEPLKQKPLERWLPPPAPAPGPPPASQPDSAFEACCYFVNDVKEGKSSESVDLSPLCFSFSSLCRLNVARYCSWGRSNVSYPKAV